MQNNSKQYFQEEIMQVPHSDPNLHEQHFDNG